MTGALARLYRGETNVDFLGKRRVWFAISGVLVGLSLIALAVRQLNYGIEFAGGVQTRAPVVDPSLEQQADIRIIEEVRAALEDLGAGSAQIQVVTGDEGKSVIVQTKEIADPERQQELVNAVATTVGAEVGETDSQRIGSKWGTEITRKAVRALVIFLLVILAFISWRFEWKMALAAIIALAHDLLITAGVYSLVGFEVTPSTIVAVLTILGYSLYDTVVVFDKVEENTTALAATGRQTYQAAANSAMNQVTMRSLNTSLTTLLPVAALLFVGAGLLGAETLKDLALALLVGILVGTYSSIFVATPVLSMWKESEPRYRAVRERVLREARRSEAAPAATPPSPGGDDRVPATRPAATRPPARARAGERKAKRRKRR